MFRGGRGRGRERTVSGRAGGPRHPIIHLQVAVDTKRVVFCAEAALPISGLGSSAFPRSVIGGHLRVYFENGSGSLKPAVDLRSNNHNLGSPIRFREGVFTCERWLVGELVPGGRHFVYFGIEVCPQNRSLS